MHDAALQELAHTLAGRIVLAGEPDMVLANKQHAAQLPLKTPRALIRCRTEQDVVASIDFLRAAGTDFSIRSGGHCFSDLSSSGDVQLDLSELSQIRMDRDLVRVGPGMLSGGLVAALIPHGLTVPTGGCPLVGFGGFALVGGFGFLGRKYGLATDRVASAKVVLADGEVVTADETSEPDLFWALRGAGTGGFGVVTELALRPVPLSQAIACFATWPIEAAEEIMEDWQRWSPKAAGNTNIELSLICPENPESSCYIRLYGMMFGNAEERHEQVLELRRHLGSFSARLQTVELEPAMAALHAVGASTFRGEPAWLPSRPYRDVGFQATRSNFFASEIGRGRIQDLIRCLQSGRGYAEAREIELIPWGGAYARETRSSCFSHRGAALLMRHTGLTGARSTVETRQRVSRWAANSSLAVASESNGRVYQGYAERARADWRTAYYGTSYPRLRAIKARYDPHQLFSGPQSID